MSRRCSIIYRHCSTIWEGSSDDRDFFLRSLHIRQEVHQDRKVGALLLMGCSVNGSTAGADEWDCSLGRRWYLATQVSHATRCRYRLRRYCVDTGSFVERASGLKKQFSTIHTVIAPEVLLVISTLHLIVATAQSRNTFTGTILEICVSYPKILS